jgi:uncharacterized membrane protein
MVKLDKLLDERKIHLVFDVTLWLKGAFAFSEILAGLAAYFVPQEFLVDLVYWVTTDEFGETRHDIISNLLLHGVEHLSVGAKTFAALYLLAHGVVKLWLIVGLLRQRLWYYPVSLIVFALFIVYQLYRYTFTHSIFLLFLTAVDIVVIVLTWHEWRFLQRSLREVPSK